MSSAEWVLIALGANLGDPFSQLGAARGELERRFGAAGVRASSIWCSRPVNCPPNSPDFLNAVLAVPRPVATSAEATLAKLHEIEAAFGRTARIQRNAPRTLDLDLILFGDLVQTGADCILPHPRALDRRFVMEPLAEVLPDLVWPGTSMRVKDVCERLRGDPNQADLERAASQWP